MGQLAAAEEAELAVRAALSQQVASFEALQADKAALEQRMLDLQVRLGLLGAAPASYHQPTMPLFPLQCTRVTTD
jgi:hypothetical protein